MSQPSTHGGTRPGAGRPVGSLNKKAAARRKRRIVVLNDDEHAQAKTLGGGNISAGLREALRLAQAMQSATRSATDMDGVVHP